MKELALATGVSNKQIIDFLYKNINSKINFCKPIITNYADNNFNYLLFACEDKFLESCEDVLRTSIIAYIEDVYKISYLKEKIKNPLNNNIAFDAYIKVLALFDKSTDESALSKILIFNQTFFIDSFLEFRLTPLKQHWDNLATLSSDNMVLFNSSTFLDVIRFLLNTMDSIAYKVKVVCKEGLFSVYNMKHKNDRVTKIAECSEAGELVTNVLNLAPSYVDVYISEDENNEAVSFLSNIFANRLKIFMKS